MGSVMVTVGIIADKVSKLQSDGAAQPASFEQSFAGGRELSVDEMFWPNTGPLRIGNYG